MTVYITCSGQDGPKDRAGKIMKCIYNNVIISFPALIIRKL